MHAEEKVSKVLVLDKDDVIALVDTMCKGADAIAGKYDSTDTLTYRFALLELAHSIEYEMED